MRNVLTVFIASPSDLSAEREVAFRLVEELNQTLKILDWSIDLLGWEDTRPGFGRPQGLINRDVERCNLFVGVLWRRWGTPPSTGGTFTSGFEEEFAVARTRRSNTSSPEIWIFFKAVETAQLADPGAQLKAVLAFRDSLIAEKTILFKDFDTTDTWRDLLRRYLLEHVLELSRLTPQFDIAAATPNIAPPGAVSANPASAPAAAADLAEFSRLLRPALDTGDLKTITETVSDGDDFAFLAVRGALLAAALVSVSGTSTPLLATHEVNTLFRYKERLHATGDELDVLFRTILGSRSDTEPGWYWFRDLDQGRVIGWLFKTILYDPDNRIRESGLNLVTEVKWPIPSNEEFRTALFHSLLNAPAALHDAAWKYLVALVTSAHLEELKRLASGTWLESRVTWLEEWLSSGRLLEAFLQKRPDPQLIPAALRSEISRELPQFCDDSLQLVAAMRLSTISSEAADELSRRGIALSDEAQAQLTAFSQSLAGLMMGRWNSPTAAGDAVESDEARRARLISLSSDVLRPLVSWYRLDGRVAYAILLERGDLDVSTVRTDLATKFQRLQDESHQRAVNEHGARAADTVREQFQELREYVTQQFAKHALQSLAPRATVDDASIARQFIDDDFTREAALRVIVAAGDSTDVPALLEIARSRVGSEQRLALDGIRQFAPDRLATAKTLISGNREMRRMALALLRDAADDEAVPFLKELLTHDEDDVRTAAVAELSHRVDEASLQQLLDGYVSALPYFYNVVVWLDRVLYAPEPIRASFVQQLQSKVQRAAD